MKGKFFKRAAAAVVAAVMTAGYLPEVSPIFETAALVYADTVKI